MSRITVTLDKDLVERVTKRFHFASNREAVEYALRRLDGQVMTREQASLMLGSIPDFPGVVDRAPRAL